jgi:hypothetical protein
MNPRTLAPILFGLVLFLWGGSARPEHEKLHRAIVELEKAREYLLIEKKHEQIEKAHRALKEAILYVKENKSEFGGRPKRLINRLEVLDLKLEKEHTKARTALDEAIVDLKFADEH